MDKNFEIADIIVAFMKGEVTPEQLVRLDEWLDESDENKRLFISLQDEKNFEHQIEVRDELDIERAFDRVKVRKRVKKYWGYRENFDCSFNCDIYDGKCHDVV